jgi:hypothetical protein
MRRIRAYTSFERPAASRSLSVDPLRALRLPRITSRGTALGSNRRTLPAQKLWNAFPKIKIRDASDSAVAVRNRPGMVKIKLRTIALLFSRLITLLAKDS